MTVKHHELIINQEHHELIINQEHHELIINQEHHELIINQEYHEPGTVHQNLRFLGIQIPKDCKQIEQIHEELCTLTLLLPNVANRRIYNKLDNNVLGNLIAGLSSASANTIF